MKKGLFSLQLVFVMMITMLMVPMSQAEAGAMGVGPNLPPTQPISSSAAFSCDDVSYLTLTGGNTFPLTHFDTTVIPLDATIDGIQVDIEFKSSEGTTLFLPSIADDGVFSTPESFVFQGTTETTYTLGGPTEDFGRPGGWTLAEISDGSFIVNLRSLSNPALVDCGQITLYYTSSGAGPDCGNGVIEIGEFCDDSNGNSGDGCSAICEIESGWSCEGATSTCTEDPDCGNGVIEIGEFCDDSNVVSGDGCSAMCDVEIGMSCEGEPSFCTLDVVLCIDDDFDGVCNELDICPGGDDALDADGDLVPDFCDICPADNPDDSDGDSVCDTNDICQGGDDALDADLDGVPDFCDICPADNPDDSDGDSVCDTNDMCPFDNPDDSDSSLVCDSEDFCGDGILSTFNNEECDDGDGLNQLEGDLCGPTPTMLCILAELPVAEANGDYSGTEGDTITFDSTGSMDPDGMIAAKAWELDNMDNDFDEGLGDSPMYTYPDNVGPFNIILRVTDDQGLTDEDTASLTITNANPIVDAGDDKISYVGEPVSASASFSDAGVNDNPWTGTVDCDDGSGFVATDQNMLNVQSTDFTKDCTFDDVGKFTITFKVTDKDGGMGQDSLDVIVVPKNMVTNSSFEFAGFGFDENNPGLYRQLFTNDNKHPGLLKFTATNPGQFMYVIFLIGDKDDVVDITANIPHPFETQGANPIHVYSDVDISNGAFAFSGDDDITSDFTINPDSITYSGTAGHPDFTLVGTPAPITIDGSLSESEFAVVTIHLDNSLKKTNGYDFSNKDITDVVDANLLELDLLNVGVVDILIPEGQMHSFTVTGNLGVASCNDSYDIQSTNLIKKNPGFEGLAWNAVTEDPVPFATVDIHDSEGKKLGSVTTDENGYFNKYYKHLGKGTSFIIVLPHYDQEQNVFLKANKLSFTEWELDIANYGYEEPTTPTEEEPTDSGSGKENPNKGPKK